MEKAFDRVWHDGLIYKLMDTSLPPALIRVVANFLQRRSFCVAVDDTTYPLHGHLGDWEDDVMLALYADDSAYFASSRRADLAAKIQRVLDLLPEWLDKWQAGGWP
ncbi:RNA-directed DNA polymerase from mobile element jockey [Eumeta japonica]|uniref:RNA-directed DNA polymerase from mobile element jockey n=1 Tax=Eumeta variegata TaxID=151549 RepID=A0A4C1WG96_EUMVA|nr:RNA-directed DNA polymerase from mobile element jockey [Eumeta japonica]